MSAPKLMPALLGGLFIGVLSSLPIIQRGNVCCCLWIVMGGAIAAWLMQQNTPRPVTPGEGALVGLLAGVFGAVTMALVNGVLALAFGMPPVFDEVKRGMESSAADPDSRAFVESVGPLFLVAVFFAVGTVVSAVMATLGGLLGAVIFRRRAGGPPPSPPMPPPSGFTPPTFTPAPPPVMAPPVPPAPPPPPVASALAEPDHEPEPYAGDAPTMLIPMRGPTLGPPPVSPSPPAPPPMPGPPATDREPESH